MNVTSGIVILNWNLWASSVRTNQVHVVLTAVNYRPQLGRDQLKAKTTIELRKAFAVWQDRAVRPRAKGDIEFLDSEEEIEQCVVYVAKAQDRKGRDQ